MFQAYWVPGHLGVDYTTIDAGLEPGPSASVGMRPSSGEECISQTDYPDPPEAIACSNTICSPINVQSQSGDYHYTASLSSTNSTDAANHACLECHPEEMDVTASLPSVYPVQYTQQFGPRLEIPIDPGLLWYDARNLVKKLNPAPNKISDIPSGLYEGISGSITHNASQPAPINILNTAVNLQSLPDGTDTGSQCEVKFQTYPAQLASDRAVLQLRVRELERDGSELGKRLLLGLQRSRDAETRCRNLAKDLLISNRRIHHLEHLVRLQDTYIDYCLVKMKMPQGHIPQSARSALDIERGLLTDDTEDRIPKRMRKSIIARHNPRGLSQVRRSARIRDKVSKQRRAKC
jgi:hypothetical protein